MVLQYCYRTVLSGNIWLELELELKLWTKSEPETKINNFGSSTLDYLTFLTFKSLDPDPDS